MGYRAHQHGVYVGVGGPDSLPKHPPSSLYPCQNALPPSCTPWQVAGNFHIAPGRSYQQGNMHVHDLSPFSGHTFDFSHTIHKLAFGQEYPVCAALGCALCCAVHRAALCCHVAWHAVG